MAMSSTTAKAASLVVFDERGLAPCIAQDASTLEVLTLAYVNAEAISLTEQTGLLHFWSRSRGAIWRKGETSGNVMRVKALRVDCDGDAVLALVEPAGPACHTGQRTCFHRGEVDGEVDGDAVGAEVGGSRAAVAVEAGDAEGENAKRMLDALERTLKGRAVERPAGSYTVELLDDPRRIGEKVMEEAEEVARAARQESDLRVDEEAADVLYHLLVLLLSRGRSLDDAERILSTRAAGGRA